MTTNIAREKIKKKTKNDPKNSKKKHHYHYYFKHLETKNTLKAKK